ncbi:MAG TPA: hypothetical protein VMU80_05255 [Bryobacteraceae bacterium]|nr:hypothetical protein [Bryobacteraceae bacterium]
MAAGSMVLLTPHDSSVLSSLVQYSRPSDRRQQLLDSLEKPDARMVGEAFFDDQKYEKAPEEVRLTVDQFRAWVDNNKHRRLQREALRRAARR